MTYYCLESCNTSQLDHMKNVCIDDCNVQLIQRCVICVLYFITNYNSVHTSIVTTFILQTTRYCKIIVNASRFMDLNY